MLRKRPMFLAAAVQLTSTSDEEANWESARGADRAGRRPRRPIRRHAREHQLPGPPRGEGPARRAADGPTVARFARARPEARHPPPARLLQREERRGGRAATTPASSSRRTGEILGTYRKIHLFDVDVPDGVRFAESRHLQAGRGDGGGRRPRSAASACRSATTCASPSSTARLADEGADVILDPLGLHPGHRQGPLGAADPRPRHREPVLRHRPGPARQARRRRPRATPGVTR